MDLTWQAIPVARLLRTQVDLLRDGLHHVRPDTVRGFGSLKRGPADYLTAWRQSAMKVLEKLEEAIDSGTMGAEVAEVWAPAVDAPPVNTLSLFQRQALGGFVSAFAADLQMAWAQAASALPPGHPTILSSYAEQDLRRLLAIAHELEGLLDALVSAFDLHAPARPSSATVIQLLMQHARDCLSLVGHEASSRGDPQAPVFVWLGITGGRNLALALNLD